jgi:two-component system chemotaxis response regulator CheB
MVKTKVLIVDDSALVRKILSEILGNAPSFEVVGTAADPYIARKKIKDLNPDVLTLDVEMPKMDGLTFLSNIMRLRPMPVVMVSSLTEKGADVTLQALDLGAVDFVTKPKLDLAHSMQDYAEEIIEKLKVAATANIRQFKEPVRIEVENKRNADAVIQKSKVRKFKTTDKIIAIGASTGGTEAIKELLLKMPINCPGIVITQHIPEGFSKKFAERMDNTLPHKVYEATDGQQIIPGHIYIAPGDKHLLVERSGARYMCKLNDGPPVNRHKPAVDVLFRSVAQNVGPNAIGVILTGMGEDGAEGLKEMHDNGAKTIAQDERTSVVWGMPAVAIKLGGVDDVLGLQRIAERIVDYVE